MQQKFVRIERDMRVTMILRRSGFVNNMILIVLDSERSEECARSKICFFEQFFKKVV